MLCDEPRKSAVVIGVVVYNTYIITFVTNQLGITARHVTLGHSVLKRLVTSVVHFYIFLTILRSGILFRQANAAVLQWGEHCRRYIHIITLQEKVMSSY